LVNLKRIDRYSIGNRIDGIFLQILELIFTAAFSHNKFEKLSVISKAIAQHDLLKFILQIAWEHKIVDNQKYSQIIIELDQIGKMLKGWEKSLKTKTSTK